MAKNNKSNKKSKAKSKLSYFLDHPQIKRGKSVGNPCNDNMMYNNKKKGSK